MSRSRLFSSNPSTRSAPAPTLPAGHPFDYVQWSGYWSATTSASDANFAWIVNFFDGNVDFFVKSNQEFAWCVRGGQGVDPQ